MLTGISALDAVEVAVKILEKRGEGRGGVILIDKQGRYGFAHKTSKMTFAYADDKGKVTARIKI